MYEICSCLSVIKIENGEWDVMRFLRHLFCLSINFDTMNETINSKICCLHLQAMNVHFVIDK